MKAQGLHGPKPGSCRAGIVGLAGLLFGKRKVAGGVARRSWQSSAASRSSVRLPTRRYQNHQAGKPLLDSARHCRRLARRAGRRLQAARSSGRPQPSTPFSAYTEDDRASLSTLRADGRERHGAAADERSLSHHGAAARRRHSTGRARPHSGREAGIDPEATRWLERGTRRPGRRGRLGRAREHAGNGAPGLCRRAHRDRPRHHAGARVPAPARRGPRSRSRPTVADRRGVEAIRAEGE